MRALGSPMLTSPSIARLAETPPMVGSVITEMNGRPFLLRRASAALVLAICMSEYSASCIRALPLAEKHTSGILFSSEVSPARTKRSPTTAHIEPPMKLNSNAHATSDTPLPWPFITITASRSPVLFCACVRRSRYFLQSRNLRTSCGSTSLPISSRGSRSRKVSRRRRAPMRMWWLHLGHTSRLRSNSERYSTAVQLAHLVHKPSGIDFLGLPSVRIFEGRSFSNQLIAIHSLSDPYAGAAQPSAARGRDDGPFAYLLLISHPSRCASRRAARPLPPQAYQAFWPARQSGSLARCPPPPRRRPWPPAPPRRRRECRSRRRWGDR